MGHTKAYSSPGVSPEDLQRDEQGSEDYSWTDFVERTRRKEVPFNLTIARSSCESCNCP